MLKRRKPASSKYDPELHFLLKIDPAFEGWRALVAEWWPTQTKGSRKFATLVDFCVHYLHAMKMDKHPRALFEKTTRLPDLWVTLQLDTLAKDEANAHHNIISDFLDWVLREKLANANAEGHYVVPVHLTHPFPRRTVKCTGKCADLNFIHVTAIDSHMEHWRALAAEWLLAQKTGIAHRHHALDRFLVTYLLANDLPRHPLEFLKRCTPKPSLSETLVASKRKGEVGQMSRGDVDLNNYAADFLDWVLSEKLSVEDDYGHRIIPSELHNPVTRLSKTGFATPTETVRSALSIRYIKELRALLAEGPNFRDWAWAQQAMEAGKNGGDWFMVDPKIINQADPDCVWRERNTSVYEQTTCKVPPRVTELWSPARAVALYLKLELPLRTFQVRMLDSGEADTWRYVHGPQGGSFELNDSALATGKTTRPYQRGIFHRHANESGAGLFINTNKTADINKAENTKGYVIPWAHETVLYWLTKLRDWQERYNPIKAPMPWLELEHKHFGNTPPHPEVLEARGVACFLFRDAASADDVNRQKPLIKLAMDRLWYLLLARLEARCVERGETLDDGSPIQFVDQTRRLGTHYPLHGLRVSLISYLVLDLQLPLAVVSKLIAGHARIVMTLYYTKFGHAYMKEVLDAAERKTLAADEASHRRFLQDATMEQISQRFASVRVDALRAAIGHKSVATFVFEDKGICPVGGSMCDVGGGCHTEQADRAYYAPVPGYPQERNCVRCRFFISGPAWLPGLVAHFNTLSYEAHERAERHNDLQEAVNLLENRRNDCQRDGRLFTEARELERLSQRYEAEAEAMGKQVNDLQATNHLIARSMEILKETSKDGVQLVAVGEMQDIQVAFTETPSEFHQIEVLCENATIYPEIDARKPAIRRGQFLDCMLAYNKMPPIFFRLNPKQQLAVGNAVMQLIQARTGSLKGALEYVEGQRRLRDLGIVDETWDVLAENVAGTSACKIIDAARGKRAPSSLNGDSDAP